MASTIGEIFVRAGLITREQLATAVEKQKQLQSHENIGELLVDMGLITERDRVRCMGEHWGVAYVDLSQQPPEPEAVRLLAQDIARRFKAIPISLQNGRLMVAMVNPLDIFAIDEIRLITGKDVEPVIATEEDVLNALNTAYRQEAAVTDVLSQVVREIDDAQVQVQSPSRVEEEENLSVEQLRELSEDAPVVRLANLIITKAIQDKASDIHVEPAKEYVKVRYRIDGIMQDAMVLPKRVQASLISRFKIMADMDIAEKRVPQDNRISAVIDGKTFDFRVSTLPSVHGEKVVMRVLDRSSITVDFHKLGMLPYTLEMFESMISRTYGIILVTGPTGSGKSTTLYSVLSKLNSGEKNILTIEDPVEYELPGLTQVNVNPRAGMTFAAGLRAMLRQDPDIIMVGEIRDAETAIIAIEAALTGHLVLSTLHTNDAPGAVARLLDMGVEPFLIASSLVGVLAQRLLRTICTKCKEPYVPPRDAMQRLGMNLEGNSNVTFYRGRGCEVCKGTGYKGRTGIYELMPVTDKVRELILARASSYAIREAAIEAGMRTLREDAMQKILLGITTLEESLRVIYAG
ncbi:MAG: type II secretion system ATPase GspE [bacterium]|nr:type II secretion system ATPase GspE [bacterium]MCS7308791.1 type II secretion system ATPase GspE [Armatimonadota bacterium]MDW8103742.1 type II secretion system ATPase GspE [Armatimonadota bacterium]